MYVDITINTVWFCFRVNAEEDGLGGCGGVQIVTPPVRISSSDALMSVLQGFGDFMSFNAKFTFRHIDAVLSQLLGRECLL